MKNKIMKIKNTIYTVFLSAVCFLGTAQMTVLNKAEKDKFHPAFMEYVKELRKTNMENRDDRLVMQQKIVDLRLRYRESFKAMMGEKKANDVFIYEREFMRELMELRKERIRKGGGKRKTGHEPIVYANLT